MSRSHITSEVKTFTPRSGYTLEGTIGVGTFGAVFLARKDDGTKVAIKKVFLDPRFKSRELEIVSKLRHPNTLVYHEHYTIGETKNDNYLNLVTDYLPKSLERFIISDKVEKEFYLQLYGFQMFAGLAYLHSQGVTHRDIKPSNILIDTDDGRLQICDFGSAKMLHHGEKSVSYIATRCYRAPELLLDCSTYTSAIDIWSAGCVLCEVLRNGSYLFDGHSNNSLLFNIVNTLGPPTDDDLNSFEHDKKYTIKVEVPEHSLKELIHGSPLFIDLMEKIFVYNPSKRITAAECMNHPYFQEFIKNPKIPEGLTTKIPEYISKMRSYEEMIKNFPYGPSNTK